MKMMHAPAHCGKLAILIRMEEYFMTQGQVTLLQTIHRSHFPSLHYLSASTGPQTFTRSLGGDRGGGGGGGGRGLCDACDGLTCLKAWERVQDLWVPREVLRGGAVGSEEKGCEVDAVIVTIGGECEVGKVGKGREDVECGGESVGGAWRGCGGAGEWGREGRGVLSTLLCRGEVRGGSRSSFASRVGKRRGHCSGVAVKNVWTHFKCTQGGGENQAYSCTADTFYGQMYIRIHKYKHG